MIGPPEYLRRGDLVWTYFDTGAMGVAVLYGVVIAAGPKSFRVRWQSGLSNRVRQAGHYLTRIPRSKVDDYHEAQKALRSVLEQGAR